MEFNTNPSAPAAPAPAPAPAAQPSSPAPAETTSVLSPEDAKAAADMQTAFPAAEPTHYNLPNLFEGDGKFENLPPHEQQYRLDSTKKIGEWLSDAGFTYNIGSHVAEVALKTSQKYAGMNEASRQLWQNEEHAKFQQLYGARTEEMRNLAGDLVRRLEAKSPGLRAMLEETGAVHDSYFVAQLAMQAERERIKKTGK